MIGAAQNQLFRTGLDYYVCARFAAFAGMTPVCGNLYHHAVELLIKGRLNAAMSLPELKQLGHRLATRIKHGTTRPGLWERFKGSVDPEDLSRFDQLVAELDQFEVIRYPDEIVANGMQMLIGIDQRMPNPPGPPPTYQIVVRELDELVKVVLERSSINPAFYLSGRPPGIKQMLLRDNDFPLIPP